VGGKPSWTAYAGSTVWVGDQAAGTVVRIDARNGSVVARVKVGPMPNDGDGPAARYELSRPDRIGHRLGTYLRLWQFAAEKESMKKITGVILALLVAGSALTAALVTSAGSAVAARRPPVAYDCQGWQHGQVQPGQILLDCLSGNVIVKTPAWKYWTGVSARSGGAVLWVNTCKPDCAAGHYRKYAASLVLYRMRSSHGSGHYTRMRLQYSHNGPRKYTYRWGTYPGASIPGWIGGP
jgi:hypothetical protein